MLIGEDPQPTPHPRIWKAKEAFLCWERLESELAALQEAMNAHDIGAIRQKMQELVSGYQPNGDDMDWLHLARKAGTGIVIDNASPAAFGRRVRSGETSCEAHLGM